MVLLDDSNSYWWLVRVVRDGSIGEFFLFLIALGGISLTSERVLACRTHRNTYGTTGKIEQAPECRCRCLPVNLVARYLLLNCIRIAFFYDAWG
jgi:hypothetical protein